MRKQPTPSLRVTGAHHAVQDALLLSDDSDDASALSDANTATTAIERACPRCHKLTKPRSKNVPVCEPCYQTLQREAEEAQEASYLKAWLRARVDERGLPREDSALTFTPAERQTVLRLAAKARRIGADWTVNEPQVAFATRMRQLLAPFSSTDDDGNEAA